MQVGTESKQFNVLAKHTTHSGGRGDAFHDWYPYLEGYSSEFVQKVVSHYLPNASLILEPFAGVGTTPLTLNSMGIACAYCEVNPAMQRVISAKLGVACADQSQLQNLLSELDAISSSLNEKIERQKPSRELSDSYKNAFGNSNFFSDVNLQQILRFRTYIDLLEQANHQLFSILEVAAMSCLIKCSLLKRAGDLRFKTEKELAKGATNFSTALKAQIALVSSDLRNLNIQHKVTSTLASADSRYIPQLPDLADGVITSPPYLNGTNYFRNTKLELWFSKHLTTKSCLRGFRDSAITSGINDVAKSKRIEVMPFLNELIKELSINAYDMRIPKMVAGYFQDMRLVFEGLSRNIKPDGRICLDIGDSIYAGTHVQTDKLLVELAQHSGLVLIEDVTLRERRSKGGQILSQKLLIFKKL